MNAIAVDQPRPARPLGFRWETAPRADANRAPRLCPPAERASARPLETDHATGFGRREQTRAARRLFCHAKRLSLALIVAFAAGLTLTHPGRVAAKTLLILPELFPDPPARPLLWVSAPPRHVEHGYDSAAGQVHSDIYLPTSDGPHGAVVLYTGVFGLRREPLLVRFGEALARSGTVVMIPESTTLRSGDITPAEVDTLLHALAYLRGRPEVDPSRIGIFGASVGGSLALLAATDEVGSEQLAFLHLIGSYYDARQLLREVASGEIELDGRRAPWEPDEVASYTLARQLIAALPHGPDRDILWRVVLDKQPMAPAELERLSSEGRLILELCSRPSRKRVDEILAGLPASSRNQLAAISPSGNIARLKARLYVMHDRSDTFIPFTQSRRLAAESPPGTLRLETESELFKHVTPDSQAHPLIFARALPALVRHAWLVGQEFM